MIRLFQFFTNPVFSWKHWNIKIKSLNNTSKSDWQTSDRRTFDEKWEYLGFYSRIKRWTWLWYCCFGDLHHANTVFLFSCLINCASKLFKDNKLLSYQGNLREDDVKIIFVLNMWWPSSNLPTEKFRAPKTGNWEQNTVI